MVEFYAESARIAAPEPLAARSGGMILVRYSTGGVKRI
jgi:hypothetical protein